MPSKGAKADAWMPLDIGRFLQDTQHLSTEEIGAYLLILMRYWTEGALPNKPAQLARTARLSLDTWSNTYESLSMFFKVGADGLLHQSGADRRRAEWWDKRKKAQEKARKAIKARWDKERAKRAAERDTPSITQEVLENYPTPVLSTSTPQGDSPSAHPPAPRGEATPPGAPGIPPGPRPAHPKSENRAKTPEKASPAPAAPVHARNPAASANGAAAAGLRSKFGHENAEVRPEKTPATIDPRFEPFRKEVFAFWSGQNPEGGICPWIPADRKALRQFLAGTPSMKLEDFKRLLRVRAHSEIVPTDPPRLWLRDLVRYAAGPLDRYKKPLRAARTL